MLVVIMHVIVPIATFGIDALLSSFLFFGIGSFSFKSSATCLLSLDKYLRGVASTLLKTILCDRARAKD
jgi:hypothetical protein